ncbi:MAG: V-type ATP synthase subunit I [Methanocellales archaeon]|nr:V-type ATP synthase subunit I [Methanocellales archaeon]
MPVADIKRVYIISHESHKEKIVSELQKVGLIEVTDLRERLVNTDWRLLLKEVGEPELRELDQKLSELDHTIDFLSNFEETGKGFIDGFFSSKTPMKRTEFERAGDFSDYKKICDRCNNLESRLNELKNEKNKLLSTLDQLSGWTGLDIPLEEIAGTEKTNIVLGIVNAFDEMKKDLTELAPETYLKAVSENEEECCILAIYMKDKEYEVTQTMRKYDFAMLTFPELTGTPSEVQARINEELSIIEKEKGDIQAEISDLLKYRPGLLARYDHIHIDREREEIIKNFAKTETSFLIEGWIKDKNVDTLRNLLKSVSNTVEIFTRDPEDGENPPIALENTTLADPFEAVVEMYSLPKYSEIDPTPIVTAFFIVFFGVCLSDVGYGIMLSIISILMMKKYVMGPIGKKFLRLLAICGVSSVFFGVLGGSWFGDLLKMPVLWVNPIDDPMTMLIFALILGITHIFVGIGAKMYNSIRRGDIKDAVFDQLTWFILLGGVVLIIVAEMNVVSLGKIPYGVAGLGAMTLVLTQGRSQKGVVKKIVFGLASLYGMVGYLGDVLSYSRLMALGLATGVIAMVFNSMALMTRGIPLIGILIAAMVLIVGHAFNLLVSTLGAFIHTCRLNYVEFFSKFYKGGGKRFSPFRISTKYVEIEEV